MAILYHFFQKDLWKIDNSFSWLPHDENSPKKQNFALLPLYLPLFHIPFKKFFFHMWNQMIIKIKS